MNWIKKLNIGFQGVKYAFVTEKSLIVQTTFVIALVIILEMYIESWEIIKQTIIFGVIILLLEFINTLVEEICDFMEPKRNKKIKQIKDLSSGMVGLGIIFFSLITIFDILIFLY